jgi:hypothetical protein
LALCVATRSSSAPIVELRPAKGLHCFEERN